jgi:hypothetical protein
MSCIVNKLGSDQHLAVDESVLNGFMLIPFSSPAPKKDNLFGFVTIHFERTYHMTGNTGACVVCSEKSLKISNG